MTEEIKFETDEEKEIYQEFFWGNTGPVSETNYVVLYSSPIEDEGKYQYQTVYVKKDDKIYCASYQRSGSYFSDYYFDYDYVLREVDPITYYTERVMNNEKLVKSIVEFVLSLPDNNGSEVQEFLKEIRV